MSRVYWDTMLFVYWLEDKQPYSQLIDAIFRRMIERGDSLCTSAFTVGELLVAPQKQGDKDLEARIQTFFEGPQVEVLPFALTTARRFAQVRASSNIRSADAIHLACAAARGVDLFLTNDHVLRKLVIPGIQFIDGIETTAFG